MPTTTIQPLPYPLPGDPADGPAQIKALAEAVEGRTVMRFASIAARDAALPSGTLVDGMVCHVASDNAVYLRSGGQWRLLWSDTGWVTVPLASGYAGTASVRRIGNQAYVRWTCTTSMASNDAALPLFTIPVGYRPIHDVAGSVSGISLYPWTCDVRSDGQVRVRNNHTAAQTNMIGSASYIAA